MSSNDSWEKILHIHLRNRDFDESYSDEEMPIPSGLELQKFLYEVLLRLSENHILRDGDNGFISLDTITLEFNIFNGEVNIKKADITAASARNFVKKEHL